MAVDRAYRIVRSRARVSTIRLERYAADGPGDAPRLVRDDEEVARVFDRERYRDDVAEQDPSRLQGRDQPA